MCQDSAHEHALDGYKLHIRPGAGLERPVHDVNRPQDSDESFTISIITLHVLKDISHLFAVEC